MADNFSHTTTAHASPQKIWRLWTDTDTWPDWNPMVVLVRLEGPFRPGTRGLMVPNRSAVSRMIITEVIHEKVTAYDLRMLLGRMHIRREMEVLPLGGIRIVQTVRFSGVLKWYHQFLYKDYYNNHLEKVLDNMVSEAMFSDY
ncbi:MAG: SRPBCC family protein [Flavobacteriales bacterium]|nr:SRPBCC family protein [Flavobacteriales bacterium]